MGSNQVAAPFSETAVDVELLFWDLEVNYNVIFDKPALSVHLGFPQT